MRFQWVKRGRIFAPLGTGFFKTHAARPIPYALDDRTLRVFFSSRDADDRMLPTFIDVDLYDPERVLHVGREPLLGLGRPGAFDDSGVTLGSLVEDESGVRLYYTGWKRRRVVSFEMSIGVARWDRGRNVLERIYEGPVLAQDLDHPFMVAGPFVLKESGSYRMWYCSANGWRFPEGSPEPIYTVHHATSADGIRWRPHGAPVIAYAYDGEVVSAPWVAKFDGRYHMWYCHRGHATRQAKNYVIGYAESEDGVTWTRLDHHAGIERSADGWDSQMACYPALFRRGDLTYLFYSGNGVGRDGLGYAIARHPV